MADPTNQLPDDLSGDIDPQSAVAAQGVSQIAKSLVDSGPMPENNEDRPIESEGSPVDLLAAGVGSAMAPSVTDAIASGMSHLEFNEIVGNEIGSIGSDIKVPEGGVQIGGPNRAMDYTPEEAGAVGQKSDLDLGAAQRTNPDVSVQTRQAQNRAERLSRQKQGFAEGGDVEPEGLNEFVGAEMSPNTQKSPNTSPDEPAGLDEFLGPELKEAKYGSVGQQAKTAIEGAGRGLVGPVAPAIETSLGVNPEDIRGRAEENPVIAGGSELAGFVAPALATSGSSLLAKAGLTGAAEVVSAAAKATQLGALEAIQAKLGLTAGETLASRVGTGAAKAAIDNMLLASSDETSKMILQDPNQSAQTAMANIGLAGVLGAGLGTTTSGLGALWESSVGDKASKLAADFKGRLQEHINNPDPVTAMTDELKNYHQDVSGIADEVYGSQGLKAQDIAKAMPEMNDKIATHARDTYDKVKESVSKMASKPNVYPPRLTQKIEGDLAAYTDKISGQNVTPGDIFNATQDLKQNLQAYAKFDRFTKPVDEAYDFVRDSKSLAHDLRTSLEDVSVWGNAAKRQQAINKAFKEYLPALKDFESKFTSEISGEKTIDQGKVNTYLNQVGKPNGTNKQTMLRNFLDASEKYKRTIDQTHANLGLESPITNSPMNVTMSSLEKKTLGSKLADAFINKGLTDAGSSTLGGAAGATIAHMMGLHGGIGAILGHQALGPFFKSVLPAMAKTMLDKEMNPSTFKAVTDYGISVAKGDALLTKATSNVLKSGTDVLSESTFPTDKEKIKLDKQLAKIELNPELLLKKANPLQEGMPDHANAMDQTTGNAITYLNSLRPDVGRKAPLDSAPTPNKADKAKFENALAIAQQPLVVLDKIKQGTLTTQDLTDLSNLYPSLLKNIQQKLTSAMTEHLSKHDSIPYKIRIGMSMLMGNPMDSSMGPASIQATQMTFNPPQQAQGNPQQSPQKPRSKSSGVKSSPALQKMPNLYSTPGQARQQRQNKE